MLCRRLSVSAQQRCLLNFLIQPDGYIPQTRMTLLSTIDSNDHLDVKTIAHTKCKPFLVGVM
jgi:hypothetical protein